MRPRDSFITSDLDQLLKAGYKAVIVTALGAASVGGTATARAAGGLQGRGAVDGMSSNTPTTK